MKRCSLPCSLPLLLMLWLLTAAAVSAAFPLQMKDDTNTLIRLAKKPMRIISITPSNTEILFALGLEKRIVGVTTNCDYPAEAKAKEKIGDQNLDFEKIVMLRPDLIVADSGLQAQSIERLRTLGLTVVAFDPTDIAATMQAITKIGEATGCEAAALKVVINMKNRMAAVKRKLGGLKETEKPRVFVEIWMDPIYTAGPGTFTSELIQLAGGNDIAYDAKPWSLFSQELILARNPQVIISQCDSAKLILKRPGWENIDAVRNGKVYDADENIFSRVGPRLVEALETLARLLHPEKYK